MPKRFLIIAAILLLVGECAAMSSQDAINFATKQHNFLYSGETVEIFPSTRISSQGKDYWVITVLSSGSLSGFIPILDSSKPSLPDSPIARRELIKTAYALRYEMKLSESSARQGLWLFDAQNVRFFADLGQDLKNEKVDLTTVKTELNGFPSLQDDVDSLVEMLDEMHPLASDISDKLLGATSFESGFVAEPDTNQLSEFQKKFQLCFDAISQLEAERSQYLALLDELRQAIASTDLPIETKQSLNSLANIPSRAQQFGSKATIAVDLEEQLNSVFSNALANVDNFTEELLTREKRDRAFQAMYGIDEEIRTKAGQGSLSQLFGVLLSEEYFFEWKEQAKLANAKENWEKAEAFFNSGSFQQAENYSARAKTDALRVFEAGLEEQPQPVNTDLLFTGAVLLIIALIVIYVLRNRGKIAGLVSQEEEEVPLHEWEK